MGVPDIGSITTFIAFPRDSTHFGGIIIQRANNYLRTIITYGQGSYQKVLAGSGDSMLVAWRASSKCDSSRKCPDRFESPTSCRQCSIERGEVYMARAV